MRTDQVKVSLTVDGVDFGLFDKKSGGKVDSDEVKYRDATGVQQSRGGPLTVENVTLSREYRIEREAAGTGGKSARDLYLKAGRGKATVLVLALDPDGNPVGHTDKFTGVLKSVDLGEADSDSNGVRMLEVEISTDSSVG